VGRGDGKGPRSQRRGPSEAVHEETFRTGGWGALGDTARRVCYAIHCERSSFLSPATRRSCGRAARDRPRRSKGLVAFATYRGSESVSERRPIQDLPVLPFRATFQPDPNRFDTTARHLRGDMLALSSLKFAAFNRDRLRHTTFVTTIGEPHAVFRRARAAVVSGYPRCYEGAQIWPGNVVASHSYRPGFLPERFHEHCLWMRRWHWCPRRRRCYRV
jgi:hypothetical protein